MLVGEQGGRERLRVEEDGAELDLAKAASTHEQGGQQKTEKQRPTNLDGMVAMESEGEECSARRWGRQAGWTAEARERASTRCLERRQGRPVG